MSELVLVRHGQARAFTDQPDRLSQMGWEQSRALGRYWSAQGIEFDAVYHGSLRRQRETCEAVAAEFDAKGSPFPEAVELPGLNEYQAQDLVVDLAPQLAEREGCFAHQWRAWQSASGYAERNRAFQRMFEALAHQWAQGRLHAPGLEPWDDFRGRVATALQGIRSEDPGGRRIAAFTSGGPIGVAVQLCLGAPHGAALAVNWRVRNASLTSFLFSGERWSLDGFNLLPHLAQTPRLVTFR